MLPGFSSKPVLKGKPIQHQLASLSRELGIGCLFPPRKKSTHSILYMRHIADVRWEHLSHPQINVSTRRNHLFNYTLWTRTLHGISCKHTVRQRRRPAIQNYTEQDSVTIELKASTAKRRNAQLLADKLYKCLTKWRSLCSSSSHGFVRGTKLQH
jgi:hypothetical protein